MPLTRGTNCGFVSSRPTAGNPGSDCATFDEYHFAFRDTSPSGGNRIIEIGWHERGITFAGGAFKVALYSDSGDMPGTLQSGFPQYGVTITDTVGWYRITGLNYSLTSNTVYWITAGHETVAGTVFIDRETGKVNEKSAKHLYANKPTIALDQQMYAVYALYEAVGGVGARFFHSNIFPTVELFKGANL